MPRTISVFLFDRFQLLDASGPIAAFEIAGRLGPDHYRLDIVSIAGGRVVSSSGVTLDSRSTNETRDADTVIVVGGEGSQQAMACDATLVWLRARATDARRLCSVCSGAFPLAAAGLLDGRRATTHWRRAGQLQRRFPAVRVEPDRIHVRDGTIWTSAGITAGIDLALALIGEDVGEEIARRVAREMVVYYRRPGGQSQFSALADLGGGETPFASLLEWIRSNLAERLTVERLAAQVAMSPRNFSRAFVGSVGVSPAKAVERLRLEAARERVEAYREPIEQIAATCGFHDPERMRRAFVRSFGQPPQTMRRTAAL